MINWLKQSPERQAELLGLVSNRTGLPADAIEKDWWVTLVLYTIFRTEWAPHLVFKGGTSLSKAWNLIERFSEDIDLVIERKALGFAEELSKNKIKDLRKASFAFTSGPFLNAIKNELLVLGIPEGSFTLLAAPSADSDRDPQVLELSYKSVLEKRTYLRDAVLIEVGARSLREPAEPREITSIINTALQDTSIGGEPFQVLTVTPVRTFLEKVFLLHEEFSKPEEKVRHDRMSRHLYDLERIMDTEYGKQALHDTALYVSIVSHREKFNFIRGLDYAGHSPQLINFVPAGDTLKAWEQDYKKMQESMIYGDSLSFRKLINRMEELLSRFRVL